MRWIGATVSHFPIDLKLLFDQVNRPFAIVDSVFNQSFVKHKNNSLEMLLAVTERTS